MCEFENITDDIYFLKTPFSAVYSGVVLINGKEKILIDSGADRKIAAKCIIPALNRLGIKAYDISWLLNTHSHGDHIGGHKRFSELGVKIAAFEKAADRLSDPVDNAVRIRTKYPKYSPAPQSFLQAVSPDRILKDNEIIAERLMTIYTPGHDDDCVCFYDLKTKTLICGDSLQGNGTATQGIGFYMSLDDYEYSLKKLRNMDISNVILGHDYDGIGGIIIGRDNSHECIEMCSRYVRLYDEFIVSCLKNGHIDMAEIAQLLIKRYGIGMPEKLFMAIYTVDNHIKRAKQKGIVQ